MPRTFIIPIASGSDPKLVEIDDAREAVGEFPPDTCEDLLFFGEFVDEPPRRCNRKDKR